MVSEQDLRRIAVFVDDGERAGTVPAAPATECRRAPGGG